LIEMIRGLPTIEPGGSPTKLAESPLIARKWPSGHDALREGRFDTEKTREILAQRMPDDALRIGGRLVVVIDGTPQPRKDAETARDLGMVWNSTEDRAIPSWKSSWIGVPLQAKGSWFWPLDVERVPTARSELTVAAEQAERTAKLLPNEQIAYAADSSYGSVGFLNRAAAIPKAAVVVRMRTNRSLRERKPDRPKGKRGRTRLHGPPFPFDAPPRDPDWSGEVAYATRVVHAEAWHGLHPKELPQVEGMAIRIRSRSRRNSWVMWLFATGDLSVADAVAIYAARFRIEHFFRFAKSSLSLDKARTPEPSSLENWQRVVMLSAAMLAVAAREARANGSGIDIRRPAWQRGAVATPGLVAASWRWIFAAFGVRPALPRPAGKAPGWPKGRPRRPRPRFDVVRKTPPASKKERLARLSA